MVNKKKSKMQKFQYIALTKNEQLMIRVIYYIDAAASIYEIYKGMVHRRYAENMPGGNSVVSEGQLKILDAHKSVYPSIMNQFDDFLKKEQLNPGLAAQYLNKEYGAGLPSFKSTESMCEEFVKNNWLGKRTIVVRGKNNKTKTLYFLTPNTRNELKGIFAIES